MSVTDFHFEGSAPTPSTTTGTSTVQLPEWYTQYTTDMLGRAQAVANLPYAQYQGPRIAQFTPTERAGFEATKTAAGAYQPFLQQAGTTLGQAGAISGLGAAEPAFTRAAGMLGGAAAQPMISQGLGMSAAGAAAPALSAAESIRSALAAEPGFSQAAGMSGVSAAQPAFSRAAGVSGAEAMRPFADRGIGAVTRAGETAVTPLAERYFQQAVGASPMAAAEPYMKQASRTFPEAAKEYMSPYIEDVVKKIADVGVRQLQEKYLPAVGQEFIGAGQFGPGPGSTRMGEFGARALRDVQEAVLGEQAKALQAGYGQAADIFGQDVGRAAQLAGTAGQLGGAQQQALLEAGTKVGQFSTEDLNRLLQSGVSVADIGAKMGQLSAADAERLISIGQQTGQLTAQDAARLADIAQSRGQLTGQDAARLAEIGQVRGTLTGQDASRILEGAQLTGQLTQQDAANLARIAEARGQLSQQDAANLQNLASKYLGMGEGAQTLGLRGGEAITGVGATERKMQQANLDLAYQDFLRQQGYPEDRVKFLASVLSGVELPQTTITQTSTTPAQPGSPSGIEQAIVGAGGLDKMLELIKKYFP